MDAIDGWGGGGALLTWKSKGEGGSSSFGNPGGWGGEKTMPSFVGVWIFSGITPCCIRSL